MNFAHVYEEMLMNKLWIGETYKELQDIPDEFEESLKRPAETVT